MIFNEKSWQWIISSSKRLVSRGVLYKSFSQGGGEIIAFFMAESALCNNDGVWSGHSR